MTTDAGATTLELATGLAQQFAARAGEADRLGQLPAEDVQALKESGYLSLSIPAEFGGWGCSLRQCLLAQLALAQGSASTAIVAGMPLHIFGSAREDNPWTDEAYEQLCWLVTRQQALINSVASEPQLGSPSRGGLPATTAERIAEGWLINGHKTWTTGGRHLTHLLVQVAIGGERGVVLIEQDRPGLEWVETWRDALSLRASDSHDLYFRHVAVPADHLISRPAESAPPPSGWFPMVMSAVYLGVAIAARNAVIQFALERVPTALGRPIATLPKTQRQIGEIDVALQAAQSFLLEVASQWPGDEAHRRQVYPRIAAVKTYINDVTAHVTEQALRIAGGASLTRDLPLERHFRDVRAGSMQPPSGDTALEIVGQAAIEQGRGSI